MLLHEQVLEVVQLRVDVPALLDLRHRVAQFLVRAAAEVGVAHPVCAVRDELRVEVEVGAAAVLEQLQARVAVLRREVDGRRERVLHDEAVVDDLPHGDHAVHEALVLLARVAEARVEDGVRLAREVVERPLARETAERLARERGAASPPLRRVGARALVARVVALRREEDRHRVEVAHALEPERADAPEVARAELLVGALRTDLVGAPAAPPLRVRGLDRAVRVLDGPLRVPAVRDEVGVAPVAVRHDLVAVRLRHLDELPQTRLAAERRLDGEDLRPASVVSAHVPAHEAELRLADALLLQLAHDVLHAVERDDLLHLRLVLGRLVRLGARHRLPRLADADLGRLHAVLEKRVVLHAFRERHNRLAVQLVFPVGARHAAVVGIAAGEEMVLD